MKDKYNNSYYFNIVKEMLFGEMSDYINGRGSAIIEKARNGNPKMMEDLDTDTVLELHSYKEIPKSWNGVVDELLKKLD